MNGQWLGTYAGTNHGFMVVNIDDRDSEYAGTAYIFDSSNQLPSLAAAIRIPKSEGKICFRTTALAPVNRETGLADSWEIVKINSPLKQSSRLTQML